MSSKEDLLRSLSVKKLRELAQENKVLLVYHNPWSFGTKKMPAKNKDEIIAVLGESRKISKKKVEAKVFPRTETTAIQRRSLAKAEKTQILKRQKHKCAMCGRDISKIAVVHYDHKKPLALNGSNSLRNRQALCPNCHAEKTQQDRLKISRAKRKSK